MQRLLIYELTNPLEIHHFGIINLIFFNFYELKMSLTENITFGYFYNYS